MTFVPREPNSDPVAWSGHQPETAFSSWASVMHDRPVMPFRFASCRSSCDSPARSPPPAHGPRSPCELRSPPPDTRRPVTSPIEYPITPPHDDAYARKKRHTVTVLPAAAFIWLGMVLAISFLEAPLKFRAPGVTLRLGLGIGRVVFAALNRVELALLLLVGIALGVGPRSPALVGMAVALAVVLGVQLGLLRPALKRRSDQVLESSDADAEPPRSHHHLLYIALETVKVVLLAALGATALATIT